MRHSTSERGAVLLIAAAFVTLIFIMASLVVDLALLSASYEKTSSHAKLVALTAVEEYFDHDELTHSQRLIKAATRAQAIAEFNLNLFAETPEGQIGGSSGAQLIPGRWFFSEEDGENPCPAGDSPPCFRPLSSGENANAFRIQGKIHTTTKTPFAGGMFGSTGKELDICTTAAVYPRHGCFLVDVSLSTVRETHFRPDQGDRYAYFLEQDNPSSPFGQTAHDQSWAAMVSQGSRTSSTPVDPTVHFHNDYELISLIDDYSSDPDYAKYHPDPSDPKNEFYQVTPANYRVDTFRDAAYRGPEPLSAILDGLHHFITEFAKRRVAGDLACIIFYDNNLNWARIFSLTSDFDYLEEVTDIYSEQGLLKSLEHGIFPFYASFTDPNLAISEALFQLADARTEGVPSADFLVHIGDGLANCSFCNSPDARRADVNGDGVVNGADIEEIRACIEDITTCAYPHQADVNRDGVINDQDWIIVQYGYSSSCAQLNQACLNIYQRYSMAMWRLRETASNSLFRGRIPLHVMLLGSYVAPHTLDIEDPDNPGACLTDAQARSREIDFVRGGTMGDYTIPDQATGQYWWEQMSDLAPFFQVNADWYRAARTTGGLWMPIRPPRSGCTPCAGSNCPRDIPCSPGSMLLNDPYCRQTTDQIKEYMNQILGENPYAIVEASCKPVPQD